MFKCLKIKKFKKGFTLIEILVGLMIFSIVVILVSAIFARAIALERRAIAAKKIQENGALIIESMAREIRVSSISGPDSLDCTVTTLNMTHPIYGAVSYSLVGEGDIRRQATSVFNINSSDVQFTRMRFCITGSGDTDSQSPKITILLSLKNKVGTYITMLDLQTTVVSRNIGSELQK